MRLPPLNTLQAFEAVARHVKVREAARELHLTESAVGKQIRRLEQLTGTRLFDRAKDGLHMTAEGRMQAAVLLVLPPGLFLVILLIHPGYVQVLLDHNYLLVGVFVSELIGALIIRKIVNFDF